MQVICTAAVGALCARGLLVLIADPKIWLASSSLVCVHQSPSCFEGALFFSSFLRELYRARLFSASCTKSTNPLRVAKLVRIYLLFSARSPRKGPPSRIEQQIWEEEKMGQPQRCRSLSWYVDVPVLSEFRSRLMSPHRCFRIYPTSRLFTFVFLTSLCFLHPFSLSLD